MVYQDIFMKVLKNTVVSLSYTMRLNNSTGEVIEDMTEAHPFIFLFTEGALLPKFEKQIQDLQSGDQFEFVVSPEEAYGEYDDESVVRLPKTMFEVNGKFDYKGVKEGEWIPLKTEDGNLVEAEVLAIDDEFVEVDFNHELAGATLYFAGEVLGIRPASKQEISQGFSVEEEE